jgi:hypothetical protein
VVIALTTIPLEMRDRAQWVVWRSLERDGRLAKVPFDPATGQRASTTDSATWGTYDSAIAAVNRHRFDGVGFVFSSTDPYCGVDLDACRDEHGELHPEAVRIVKALNGYTETSPSGRGLHVIVKARVEGRGRRLAKAPWGGGLELYSQGRYFTVTGHGTGRPRHGQPAINALLEELVAPALKPAAAAAAATTPAGPSDHLLLLRMFSARNGVKSQALFAGDTSTYGSPSEADLALIGHLAYWTGPDPDRIDRLFRQSGLMRDKWDSRRGDSTYGRQTIEKALDRRATYHDWGRQRRAPHTESLQPPPTEAASCTTSTVATTGTSGTSPDTVAVLDKEDDKAVPVTISDLESSIPSHPPLCSPLSGPGPGQVNLGNPDNNRCSDTAASPLENTDEDAGGKQLWELLRRWRSGEIEPEPIELGPLPDRPSRAMRALHEFLAVCFGLRLADGTHAPMMMACSVLVREGIVTTKAGASWLLRHFQDLGIIWSPGELAKRGKGNGTRLFLPGRKPDGPEPQDGWLSADPELLRVYPASDRMPGSALESKPVAVERENVEGGVPIQPSVEAPHKALVGDAVCESVDGAALGLDGVATAGDAASGAVRQRVTKGSGGGGSAAAGSAADAQQATASQPRRSACCCVDEGVLDSTGHCSRCEGWCSC